MSTDNSQHNLRVDYVEFPATDMAETKKFYSGVFGWKFEDFGPGYMAFHDGRLNGGFFKAASGVSGPLVVIYATDLEAVEESIKAAGGRIVKQTVSFPGGRRFHFTDPSGNELSVWSDRDAKQ
jgi:hypothetical protein